MIRKDRIQRLQENMAKEGMDAYLILTHDDYFYFLGEDRYQPRAIIPQKGKPVIVAFFGEEKDIKQSMGLEDVRIFKTVGQQIKDVVTLMKTLSMGKSELVVGVQMGFATPAFLLNLFQRANPQVKVVDIHPAVSMLRAMKEKEEIDAITQAARLAELGMEKARNILRPGIKEVQVAWEIEKTVREAGASGFAVPIFVNSGPRSGFLHGTATQRVIQKGDLVVIDIVPIYQGYVANLTRTFVVGKATEEQKRWFTCYKEAQDATLKVMKPGVKMQKVDDAAMAVFGAYGYKDQFVFGFSHGLGLAFEEYPMPTIHPAHAGATIEKGMVLTSGHSVLSFPGKGGVRLEDTYLIGEEGPQPLTRFPKQLED